MYDLLVIGGGPAGYVAAERAGKAGLSTVLVEKNHLGGVCLNDGCIPSKILLNSANLYRQAAHSEKFGVHASNVTFDLATVMNRKNKVIDTYNSLTQPIAESTKRFSICSMLVWRTSFPRTR